LTLLLRTTSNPTGYVSAVRDVVRKIDPGIALRGINTLEEEVADSIAIVRIMGILMGIFGVVALALSSLGVYGVLSESVAQRTHEIGIRLALGAKPRDLLKLILGQALKLTGIGLVIAVPCAVAISRAMACLIFGVVSVDFTILGGFTALLLLVALGAGYLLRAARLASTRWFLCATNSAGYLRLLRVFMRLSSSQERYFFEPSVIGNAMNSGN